MSLTAFLALSILGLDFMIYALFQWIYGERRRGFTRQAANRKARKDQTDSPFLVITKRAALHTPRPLRAKSAPKPTFSNPPTQIRRGQYTERIA
jgi:hypothetical protein